MYSFIFVTHGNLGSALVETAEFIMKRNALSQVRVHSIDYSMLSDMDKLQEEIKKGVETFLKEDRKVVIFVDIFGGSPSNVAFTFSKREHVDIVSGVNLPMTLYAFEHLESDISLSEFVKGAIQCGSDNLISAKKLIEGREKK